MIRVPFLPLLCVNVRQRCSLFTPGRRNKNLLHFFHKYFQLEILGLLERRPNEVIDKIENMHHIPTSHPRRHGCAGENAHGSSPGI